MTSVPPFHHDSQMKESEIHSDVRNAAQRYSSSSRLVALKATRDQKETGAMLERMRRAQEAIEIATEAIRLAEQERSRDPR